MWLAQQHQGLDSQLIYLLVVVALSVLGTILGKKNKPGEKTPPRQAPRESRPSMGQPPVPPRPVEPSADRSELILFPRPIERPVPRPRPVRIKPPKARPARPMPPEYLATAVEPVAVEIIADSVEIVAEPDETRAASPAKATAGMSSLAKSASRPSFDPAAFKQRLKNPADLRTAYILSEILAPPVALRDNQPPV